MATSDPIELAIEIMVAFVANNAVPRADLPALFEGLHSALKRLTEGGEVATAAIDPPAPAVSIRKSVTPDYLICLEDGKRFKSLRRHLAMLGMTPEQYRAKWNLPSTYPMVAQFHGAAIGICEEQRVWAAREAHRRPAGGRSRDRGRHRHDRGGHSRADERHQAQSQGQEQGGRGRAGGPGETQTRSPAQGDGVSKLRKLAEDRPKPIRAGIQAFAGMPMTIAPLSETYAKAWRVRFAYGCYYTDGQFAPCG